MTFRIWIGTEHELLVILENLNVKHKTINILHCNISFLNNLIYKTKQNSSENIQQKPTSQQSYFHAHLYHPKSPKKAYCIAKH